MPESVKIVFQIVSDEELDSEIKDLEDYVEKLYLSFENNNSRAIDLSNTLTNQLNNISMLNQVNLT